jgi:membrane-associated protein
MDAVINFMITHAAHAHWIIFGSLLLSSLNLPISEDFMIIITAILASTVIPEHTVILIIWLFLGCFISDMIVYWIGRTVGRKIIATKWVRKTITPKKLKRTYNFYKKYGFYTLLVGRFIPFGIRNCLFMTAGMSKMHFPKFLLSDGIACLISNAVLFSITFFLGKNYHVLAKHLKTFNLSIFLAFIVTLVILVWYYRKRRKKRMKDILKIDDNSNKDL